MSKLVDKLIQSPSRREPAYRPLARVSEEEREGLARKLGSPANYNNQILRDMVVASPGNLEFRKAMVSAIMSAEFAGIDAFSRKVAEWQEWDVPWTLMMAMARQTWDEVRHAQLSKGVLESYGGELGEYPDTLAGAAGPQGQNQQPAEPAAEAQTNGQKREPTGAGMRDPIVSLSTTNVSLEGGALTLFKGTSEMGRKIGDTLMEHCYDYNWADEVTHVAIGDYFVKLLCEGDPVKERRALAAHARHEAMRAGLTNEQTEELKAFFEEEMDRGMEALSGSGDAQPAPGERNYA
jgi:uncharacterized ferritin-like protein (DUF455 family)